MQALSIDAGRLLERLSELGEIGHDGEGRLTRLAASDADRAGRDRLVGWLREAGLEVAIDRIGNIFGIWRGSAASDADPILLGSHIDTVIDAGIYDGCYGVLAGLAVIETLKAAGVEPERPVAVAAFTNEEGVRYAPDMMGSLVHAGGLPLEAALASVGTDGTVLGAELARIGYAGDREPGFLRPHAYVELHIEQGPVLEAEGTLIGAVENLQGISWQRVTIEGVANHAGTTPMAMRRDAGLAAARVVTWLRDLATASNAPTVATVGTMRFEPDAINVIPARAIFTIDLRDPDADRLAAAEARLAAELERLAEAEGVAITTERLARFEPVTFDLRLVAAIGDAAAARGLSWRRMTSGAGHDAQMIARIAPAAMIFVPSRGGISHNPREFTEPAALAAGANVLLDVVRGLVVTKKGD
jgi:amidase, hydantoinase/carbamoylase family